MTRRTSWLWFLLGACGPGPTPEAPIDTEVVDTDVLDTDVLDTDVLDTDVVDTDWPDPVVGYGEIRGQCGGLRAVALDDTTASTLRNEIDFGTTAYDVDLLSDEAEVVATTPSLNPNSVLSEAIAFEVLYRCEGADLISTETQVGYTNPDGKKTDLVIEVDGDRVGVSVTRAFRYPPDSVFTVDGAGELLDDKLADIQLSNANVLPSERWSRHVLHVVAWNDQHADAIESALPSVSAATRGDTIVYVTVTSGDDGYVYGITTD